MVFLGTGGEAMGRRSQPPPPSSCQDNKAPKSPLPLPSLPFFPHHFAHAHLSSPSLYLGHDCAGCGGFSCQQDHLTAKKEKQRKSHGAGVGGRATKKLLLERPKEFWVSKGYNSSPHTHTLLVWPFQAPWHSSIYQEKLRRNPWSSCYYATLLG